jgi:hypothetical protein
MRLILKLTMVSLQLLYSINCLTIGAEAIMHGDWPYIYI